MPRLADARTIRSTLLCVGLVLAIGFPRTILADTAGIASVIDGDTIEIHDQRIRLHGIDAPESSQTCLDTAGQNWRCGQQAALALQELIGRRTVTCHERDVDRYRRVVAQCFAGETDITSGSWARAWPSPTGYSRDYVAAEDGARQARRGMWAERSSRHGTGDGAECRILAQHFVGHQPLVWRAAIPRSSSDGACPRH